jgi:NADPH:quinone reductase-like Zn-dependent oxidoreductase
MGGAPLKPKNTILGADVAGRVEAVGGSVRLFQPGDEVFGDISACGFGGFAEYVSVPENALALKPTNISFEEAAAVPMAGVVALQVFGMQDRFGQDRGFSSLVRRLHARGFRPERAAL